MQAFYCPKIDTQKLYDYMQSIDPRHVALAAAILAAGGSAAAFYRYNQSRDNNAALELVKKLKSQSARNIYFSMLNESTKLRSKNNVWNNALVSKARENRTPVKKRST